MPAPLSSASTSAGMYWTGAVITGLVIAFLVFDAVGKLIQVAPVVEASEQLGLPRGSILPIGGLLLVCTVIYANPSTAVLGAILLTGYLGGAVAIHVRAANGTFPIVFSLMFGVLAWSGLLLREPRLFWTILSRR